jgi:hypothetical protein
MAALLNGVTGGSNQGVGAALSLANPMQQILLSDTKRGVVSQPIYPGPLGWAWNPAYYPTGVVASWHDPSDITRLANTSGSVDSDADLANNYTETQTSTARPTVSSSAINGLTAEAFASGQYLLTGIPSGPTLRSIIWVINPTTLNAFNAVLAVTGTGGFEVEIQSNGAVIIVAKAVTILATGTAGAVTTGPQILTTTWNDNTGAWTVFVNGTAKGSGIAGHPSFTGVVVQSTVSFFTTSDSFIGTMGERITLNDVTASNIQLAEGYLAWKWGLSSSLDAGHPYKAAAPTLGDAIAATTTYVWARNRNYVRR